MRELIDKLQKRDHGKMHEVVDEICEILHLMDNRLATIEEKAFHSLGWESEPAAPPQPRDIEK